MNDRSTFQSRMLGGKKRKLSVMSSDGSSDENQTSVVRRGNKDTRVNPMIQKVILEKSHLVVISG